MRPPARDEMTLARAILWALPIGLGTAGLYVVVRIACAALRGGVP